MAIYHSKSIHFHAAGKYDPPDEIIVWSEDHIKGFSWSFNKTSTDKENWYTWDIPEKYADIFAKKFKKYIDSR